MSINEAKTRAQEIAETVFVRAGNTSKVTITNVVFDRQNNFMTVALEGRVGRQKLFSMGVSKCNTVDKFNTDVGFNLAVQRAVRKAL